MKLDDLLDRVAEIPSNASYWFVRTESGDYFDIFYENNFIGIGWNEIRIIDLEKPIEEVKRKIATTQNININIKNGQSKVTTIYTKLQRFRDLRKNDVIVIPSKSSNYLAFGIIADNNIYSETNVAKISECPFRKRRKVKWIKSERLTRLSDGFYKIKQSRHAISNISKYSEYIDSETGNLFTKDQKVHFVLDVERAEYIDFEQLTGFMTELKKLSHLIDKDFNLSDNNPIGIWLELQSPGKIELFRSAGKGLIILAVLLASCKNGQVEKTNVKEIDNFAAQHVDTLKKVDSYMDSLEIDRKKLFKP